MKIFKILLVTTIILGFNSCSFQAPKVKELNNIHFISLNDNVVDIELNAIISNPNTQTIVIKKFEFDLIINGKLIGTVKNKKKIEILPDENRKYKLPVEIEVKDLISGISNVLKFIKNQESIDKNMIIKGTVKGKRGFIPFRKKVNTNLEELL